MKKPFTFIAGPCVIEDAASSLEIASFLKKAVSPYPFNFIFKASFDKANRTSVSSYRGPGLKKGLKILEKIKNKLNVSIISDVHSASQVKQVKDVLDIIQIPAFLCRQTDLIIEAAKTKKVVNIKKGQFISPQDVKYIIEKIISTGNNKIMVTERGTSFGYNNLIVDYRSFVLMKDFGYPVIYDVTHSQQRPSAKGGISGGDTRFVEPMSLAAVACGVNGLFMEVHPNPKKALSDKYTSYALNRIPALLEKIFSVKKALIK